MRDEENAIPAFRNAPVRVAPTPVSSKPSHCKVRVFSYSRHPSRLECHQIVGPIRLPRQRQSSCVFPGIERTAQLHSMAENPGKESKTLKLANIPGDLVECVHERILILILSASATTPANR